MEELERRVQSMERNAAFRRSGPMQAGKAKRDVIVHLCRSTCGEMRFHLLDLNDGTPCRTSRFISSRSVL